MQHLADWTASDPSVQFTGHGHLRFTLLRTDSSASNTVEMPIDTKSLASRVIFVIDLGDGTAQLQPAVAPALASFLLALWHHTAPITPEVLSASRLYHAAWLCGLLFAALNGLPRAEDSASTNTALQCISTCTLRFFGNRTHNEVSCNEVLLLWTVVGQAISQCQRIDPAASIVVPDALWDVMSLLPVDLAPIKAWFAAQLQDADAALARSHVKYLLKTGLVAICTLDRVAPYSTFRFVRGLPLMTGLALLPDASALVVAAIADLQRTDNGHKVAQSIQQIVNKELRLPDKDNNVMTRVLEYCSFVRARFDEVHAALLGELTSLQTQFSVHFSHPLHSTAPESARTLVEGVDTAMMGMQSAYRAGALLRDIAVHIEAAKQADLLHLHSPQMKTIMTQVKLNTLDLALPQDAYKAAMQRAKQQRKIAVEVQKDSDVFVSFTVSTIAGTVSAKGFQDGPASSASFSAPIDIIELPSADYLILEQKNSSIRRVARDGSVTTVVGRSGEGFVDGPAAQAKLQRPRGFFLCRDGSILIADAGNHCIRRLAADFSLVTTIAGTGQQGIADGPAKAATFKFPAAVLELDDGSIVVCRRFVSCARFLLTPLPLRLQTSTTMSSGVCPSWTGTSSSTLLPEARLARRDIATAQRWRQCSTDLCRSAKRMTMRYSLLTAPHIASAR